MTPMPLVPFQDQMRTIAIKLLRALDQQGFTHQNGDGSTFAVNFSALTLYGDSLLALEVDVERLWHISVADLARPNLVAQLSAVAKRPVRAVTRPGRGFLYLVQLKPPPVVRLPRSARLDLGQRPPGDLLVPLGVSRAGPVWRDLSQLGHILVGGVTGSGKSNWLQSMLAALLTHATPQQLQLVLIDPKVVEFAQWAGVPHLLRPAAHDLDTATLAGQDLLKEVNRRFDLLRAAQVRDLAGYNRTARAPLPVIVVVVDEFLELALEGGPRCEFYKTLTRLANRARAAGVRLVLSATNPKAEVLNTSLRNACSTRLAFRCTESGQSRAILETPGAEKLPPAIPGRCLARLPDAAGLHELQAWYVDDQDLAHVVHGLRGQPPQPKSPQPVFTDDERTVAEALLRPAGAGGLAGVFSVEKLAAALKGRVSYRKIARLGRQWEARGWLEPQATPTSGRPVSVEFRRLITQAGVASGACSQ